LLFFDKGSFPINKTSMTGSPNVTELLARWSQGDSAALDQLTPFVYEELRRLAAHYLRNERPQHTLQATALVHEAYIQLLGMSDVDWQNRSHFVATAATMMRHILVDHARKLRADKRGGNEAPVPLSRAGKVALKETVDLCELDEALKSFAGAYPRQAQVVELKFFGGLNSEETAQVMTAAGTETSTRTVERDWRFARAWLLKAICDD
jgi:RNA polymerase sigma factor (TIGR02999 family)